MKKIILSLMVVATLLIPACKSKENATKQYAPWLQEKMTVLNDRHSEIRLYDWDGKTYYAIYVQGPEKSFDMNRTTIYDANGEEYITLGGPPRKNEKVDEFFRNAEMKGVIWQSDAAKEKSEK